MSFNNLQPMNAELQKKCTFIRSKRKKNKTLRKTRTDKIVCLFSKDTSNIKALFPEEVSDLS